MRRVIAVTAFLVAISLLPAGAAQAAAGGRPAWTVAALPYPGVFQKGASFDSTQRGPAYQLQVYNVGGAPTEGKFTITDTLPGPMTPSSTHSPLGVYGPEHKKLPLNCETSGQIVTCTSGELAPGPGPEPEPEPLLPGEEASVIVPLEVSASAPATVLNKVKVEGGGGAAATVNQQTKVSAESASFGFVNGAMGLFGSVSNADGSAATQAGSHPYQATVAALGLNSVPNGTIDDVADPGGGLHEVQVTLPPGMVVDPEATAHCTETELHNGVVGCPEGTQIGVVALNLSLSQGFGQGPSMHPLYNMVPAPGSPATFAFEVVEGLYVHLVGQVRADGSFQLAAKSSDVPAVKTIGGVRTVLWGDPSDESHDSQRGECITAVAQQRLCPTERTEKALLTMPSACGGPLTTRAAIDSWRELGVFQERSYESTDLEGHPVGIDGCNALQFEPTIEARATTNQGETPSGLEFDLHQPLHEESFEELASAALKDATVTLPEGMALNPAAANGREACSAAQLGVTTAPGVTPIRYVEDPAHCPASSKLGLAEAKTPLVNHPLKGAVYLAKPFDNPFGTLLGIYLVIEDEETGVIAKLAGKVTADPVTGQLTTAFEESPQLPLEDVKLDLFNGVRAPLTTPLTCGEKVSTSTLTPWSTPEGTDAHPSGKFETTAGCYGSEAAAPGEVTLTAGTESPLSGAYSPFVLRLSRKDGSQHITGVETTLPEGLLGKLAGVSYCPESGIAQAISREAPEKGREEIASPSCPASSEVGTVNVTAGSGIAPIPVSGHAYLAGPYKGAPLSLVVIVPAVAGPFDLGTVVDRVALNVGEYDARIHAVSDPLPTIRDGIPLDVRSIELKLNRSNFTLNPTSCDAMAIEGAAATQAGQSAALKNSFQVGECGRLAFKPKVAISLNGPTKRTGLPALKATVTYPQGGAYANIARAQVSLPHSEFLEQNNLNQTCTKPVLAAHACPANTVYGKAKAWSPLLEKPLEGNVYLVGGYGYKLPAMVAELDGQIRVLLVGKVDTGSNGGIRNTFEAVPDAPVEKFTLELKGGKKYGLLINSENICQKKQMAQASFTAQNGKTLVLSPTIANSCKGGSKKSKGKKSTKKK
jgi:hypothetical protein